MFSCRNKGCRRKEGSIRALRATRVSVEAVKKDKERKEKETKEKEEAERREKERKEKDGKLGSAVFGVSGNPFAKTAGSGNANPFATGAGAMSANPFAKPAAGGANPFGTSNSSTQAEKPAEPETKATQELPKDLPRTFAETLSLNNNNNPQTTAGPPSPPEPWPAESELPPAYPVSYLGEAEYETLDPLPLPPQAITTGTMDLEDASGSASGGGNGKEDKDVFESTIDSTFQKFADRLAQNPDQCIRYEFGGQPLLYSKTDTVGKKLHDVPASGVGKALPRCGSCGSERVFEVQMTSQAIAELEEGEDDMEGIDWGTVIVGVCGRDCLGRDMVEGGTAYVEEWAGVQWEELTARR